MIEDIEEIAKVLKVAVGTLKPLVDKCIKGVSVRKLASYEQARRKYARPAALAEFAGKFYGRGDDTSRLGQCSVQVDSQLLETTIYTLPQYLGIDVDPLSLDMTASHGKLPLEEPLAGTSHRLTAQLVATVEKQHKRLENLPLYRLLRFGEEPIPSRFNVIRFFDYRFSFGLLEDELVDALIKAEGDVEQVLRDAGSSLLRSQLLPDLSSLAGVESRICSGGIGVVVALRSGKEYLIPIQQRGKSVSDNPGMRALIPKAFHQPLKGFPAEANVCSTTFRELYEELLGGHDAETDAGIREHDWYMYRCPAMRWFREHDSFICEVVAFGLNAVAGNFDYGVLLVVQDSHFYRTHVASMTKNWEADDIFWISTADRQGLADLITHGNWANESLFHFVSGLIRLNRIKRERVIVDLPALAISLADIRKQE